MLANFAGVFAPESSILLPASRRPCIQFAFANWRPKLALAELEALPRAFLAVFLALSHARIARQKSVGPQPMAQIGIEDGKRAREAHAHRAGLTSHPAAIASCHYVKLVGGIRKLQRLYRAVQPSDIFEVRIDSPAIYFKFPAARPNEYPRHGILAPARAIAL
jgi:hypothetical protein